MELVYIGRIITTHGIKGEIKLRSNFKYKKDAFKVGNTIYIDKEKHEILSYRTHQEYDMLTISDIDSIDKAIPLKQKLVYIERKDLNLKDNYVVEDYIGSKVFFNDELVGMVEDVQDTGNGNLNFVISGKYIPYNANFVRSFSKEHKELVLKNVEGLLWK